VASLDVWQVLAGMDHPGVCPGWQKEGAGLLLAKEDAQDLFFFRKCTFQSEKRGSEGRHVKLKLPMVCG